MEPLSHLPNRGTPMTNSTCPECGSARVHRSRRRQPIERAIALLGGGMRRCHECNSRYAQFGASWLRMSDLRKITQKLLLIIAMGAAAALILAATLWFSRGTSTPSNDAGRIASPGSSSTTGYQTKQS